MIGGIGWDTGTTRFATPLANSQLRYRHSYVITSSDKVFRDLLMHRKTSALTGNKMLGLERSALIGAVTAIFFFVISTALTVYTVQNVRDSNARVTHVGLHAELSQFFHREVSHL